MSGNCSCLVALVSGTSRGIGEAVAVDLAGAGATVAVTSRSAEGRPVAERCRHHGTEAHSLAADITDPTTSEAAVQGVLGGMAAA